MDGNNKTEKMETEKQKYNWKLRIGLSAFVLFTVYAINFILNPYASTWTELLSWSKFELAFDFLLTFLFCWLIIEASIGISNILKFVRVDLVRRFTYLDNPNVARYGIRIRFKFDL